MCVSLPNRKDKQSARTPHPHSMRIGLSPLGSDSPTGSPVRGRGEPPYRVKQLKG